MRSLPSREITRALALAGTVSALSRACGLSRQTVYNLLAAKARTVSTQAKLENFIQSEECRRGPRRRRAPRTIAGALESELA